MSPPIAKNVILFGQTGAGKSSIINLIAGEKRAKTSLGTDRCTMHWEEYSIQIDGCNYKVFDTAGLEDSPWLRMEEYINAIVDTYKLMTKLNNEGGVDLLLFCMRAGRVTSGLQSNYRLFYRWLCKKKVPIVLLVTGLERENTMEDWWERNEHTIRAYDIHVTGHACITAGNALDERQQQLYQESCDVVRQLLIRYTHEKQDGFKRWFHRVLLDITKNNGIVATLTKRCGVPADIAVQLAERLEVGEKEVSSGVSSEVVLAKKHSPEHGEEASHNLSGIFCHVSTLTHSGLRRSTLP